MASNVIVGGFDFLKPPKSTGQEVTAAQMFNAIVMLNRTMWLTLLTQQPIPTTKFGASMRGDKIGSTDQYISLYKNATNNPVAVRVAADFQGGPGRHVKLSLTSQKDDSGVVDYLGDAANAPSFNKRLSDTIVLSPGGELFVNTAKIAFALTNIDTLRVRVFDIATLLTDPKWEVR